MVAVRKRDLLETLANDDPSAFGYDKKRKRFRDGLKYASQVL